MSTTALGKCVFCGASLAVGTSDIREEVLQWVAHDKKDRSTAREYTGRRACGTCITKKADGQDPAQLTLFDEPAEEDEPNAWVGSDWHAGYAAGWRNDELVVEYSEVYMSGYEAGQTARQEA